MAMKKNLMSTLSLLRPLAGAVAALDRTSTNEHEYALHVE